MFINNTPNMMSVALNAITQFLSLPLPGADSVDYLEPNELQLEEPFPCIWNPWVTVIAFRVSVNVIFMDLSVAISPFGRLKDFSDSTLI